MVTARQLFYRSHSFASLFGVLGLSALVTFINGALTYTILTNDRHRWRVMAGAALVVFIVTAFGAWRLHDNRLNREGTSLRVSAIQGNVLQHEKWDPRFRDQILEKYLLLTKKAINDGARLIVWP